MKRPIIVPASQSRYNADMKRHRVADPTTTLEKRTYPILQHIALEIHDASVHGFNHVLIKPDDLYPLVLQCLSRSERQFLQGLVSTSVNDHYSSVSVPDYKSRDYFHQEMESQHTLIHKTISSFFEPITAYLKDRGYSLHLTHYKQQGELKFTYTITWKD